MRTHTTSTLRTLVIEAMNPKNTMTAQEIETWSDLIPEITEELMGQMKFFVYSIFQKSLVRRQLNQMQTECTTLLNALDKYTELSMELLALKVLVLDCLDATLKMIVYHYKDYADLTMKMSGIHFRSATEIFKSQADQIRKLMTGLKAEAELQHLVLESMLDVLKKKTASYETVHYVATLQIDLLQILPQLRHDTVKEVICDYLYQAHYNTERFVAFLKNNFKVQMASFQNLHDRRSYLLRIPEEWRKLRVAPKKPKFLPKESMIHDRLLQFIETEDHCLKIAIKKATPLPVAIAAPAPIPFAPVDYKLRFNFSVDCLAFLIRLMVDASVIEPGLKSEMQRYIAANFQTPGTTVAGISPGSFLTKYKNVTHTTYLRQ